MASAFPGLSECKRVEGRRTIAGLLAVALLLLAPARVVAHDIPASVIVQAFVKPQGHQLHLLVRVPLGAMRDVEFPVRGEELLDLVRADRSLRDAAMLWVASSVDMYEESTLLAAPEMIEARVSLPSDRSFLTYDEALAHVLGPRLPDETTVYWKQAMLDLLFEYRIRSDRSNFSIRPSFARLGARVTTALRYLPPAGGVRAFEYSGDPGLVRLDPRWHHAARNFVGFGFAHILGGTDHLLFLLCLVIPFRRLRPLVLIVTAFTVAHSMALIASALDLAPSGLWFQPLIEMLIAGSILYMALENILGIANLQRRWIVAFAFGLVHGFGFSFALRETLQFAGSHLLASLIAFNMGVELGQLLVLVLLVPALQGLFRFGIDERIGTIVVSAFVAHTGWHWSIDRWERLRQVQWPPIDVLLLAGVVRWLLVLVVIAGAMWMVGAVVRRKKRKPAVD